MLNMEPQFFIAVRSKRRFVVGRSFVFAHSNRSKQTKHTEKPNQNLHVATHTHPSQAFSKLCLRLVSCGGGDFGFAWVVVFFLEWFCWEEMSEATNANIARLALHHLYQMAFSPLHLASLSSLFFFVLSFSIMQARHADGSEDWFLQISELADGRFICSVYSNEPRAAGSKLFFKDFLVRMRIENLPLPSTVKPEHCDQYIAREPGRVHLGDDAVDFSYDASPSLREAKLSNSDDFHGRLNYVKVFA